MFLFGMRIMSDGLQNLAGPKMRHVLEKMTSNRVIALIAGAAITAIIQSSSATTVMTVGLVNAGLMNLAQSIGIILGANIGTTITGQLVALKLTDWALPAIAVGSFMRLFAKQEKGKFWGDFLVGFGLLFYGMVLMKHGVGPLKSAPWIETAFIQFSANPILGVVAGALITMLLQSSSATVALTMTMASTGVIDFPAAAALVLGENIGTTITAQLAAIGTNVSAKRVAMCHMLFNVFGVCVILAIFQPFCNFILWFSANQAELLEKVFFLRFLVEDGAASIEVANFHTFFNVTNGLFFLLLVKPLATVATWLVPGEVKPRKFRLDSMENSIFSSPPLALDEARLELKLMGDEVCGMLEVAKGPLMDSKFKDAEKLFEGMDETESYVDDLQKEINSFLTELSRKSITESQAHEIFSMIYMTSNLEKIGDHAEKLARLCKRRNTYNLDFSEQGRADMQVIYEHTLKYLRLIVGAIEEPVDHLMDKVIRYESELNEMRKKMRRNHMERLQASACNADAGLVYVDMINSFEKIGDHAFNIAESLSGRK